MPSAECDPTDPTSNLPQKMKSQLAKGRIGFGSRSQKRQLTFSRLPKMVSQSIVAVLFISLLSLTGSVSGVFHTSSFANHGGGASNSFSSPASTRPSPLTAAIQARAIRDAHVTQAGLATNLARGAILRIASDLSGGTPLESIKCRVTVTKENMFAAFSAIRAQDGLAGLWSGTPSRTVEGALLGAVFMLGSTLTKKQALAMGASKTVAALAGGLVGGVAQSVVMTPAGMIFTSLNVNRGKKGYENDNAFTVSKRIIAQKGPLGLYFGIVPMCARQASNWASRSAFTEIARTTFGMSKYGVLGEIGSGVIGGLGSCWNTPIETIRVLLQRDVTLGKTTQPFGTYWQEIVDEQGYPGLFRGVTPRGIQAIWQTIFMVVVPNMMGI